MRISRLHIGIRPVVGDEISLDRGQSHYLKNVLRLKSGAAVVLFDGVEAVDYQSRLMLEGKQAKVCIESAQALDNESPLDSEIVQGLARNDHLDWMIQKTTELGVTKISIFNAERSQSPLKTRTARKETGTLEKRRDQRLRTVRARDPAEDSVLWRAWTSPGGIGPDN